MQCEKCGHDFEVFQSMTTKPLEVCPQDKCGRKRWAKGTVKRQLGTGAGLIFKGSGFYTTDYRSEGYKASAKKESEAASKKPEKSAKKETKSSSNGTKKTAKPKS